MPPVVAGVAAGALAATIVSAGWAVAIGLATALVVGLTPEMPDVSGLDSTAQQLRVESNPTRYMVVGQAVTSGPILRYENLKENDKEYNLIIAPLANHPCESVELYQLDGQENTSLTGEGYRIVVQLGDQTTALPIALSEMSSIDETCIGYNITYAYMKFEINSELFPNGTQDVKFLVKGLKVYDPRLDSTQGGIGAHRADDESTWSWTDNAALINLHWKRFGGADELPFDLFDPQNIAYEANLCDELVTFTDSNGDEQTEKRWTCNGLIDLSKGQRSVEEQLLMTCGGKWDEKPGKYYLLTAAYRGPGTVTLDDNDLKDDIHRDPYIPLEDRFNAVKSTFFDPQAFYQETTSVEIGSTYYQTVRDKRYLPHKNDRAFTNSGTMCQRLDRLQMERNAAGDTLTIVVGWKGLKCGLGTVVTANFEEAGIVGKEYEVIAPPAFNQSEFECTLQLRETSAAIYADTIVPAEADLTPNTTIDNTVVDQPTSLIYTATPEDSYRQGYLSWVHNNPNNIRRYVVLLTRVPDDGWYKVLYPVQPSQDINNLPVGNYQATVSAQNRFDKSSSATPLTFNLAATSTPTSGWSVVTLPGRVIITGPTPPHEGATYEWHYSFDGVFDNGYDGGRNLTLTITNTPHGGSVKVWYRLIDGEVSDPAWQSFTVVNLIGIGTDSLDPQAVGSVVLPTFPKTIFDTFTGLQNAVNFTNNAIDDNEEALEALLATAANALISEDININREIGLRTEILRTNETFELVQTSIEQKADSITLEAIRVNLQSQIDGAVFGDQTAYVDAKLGDLEGRVEETELQLTPSALTATVQTIVLEQELATQTFVQQQISDLGISNYVTQTTFDAEKVRIDAAEETLNSSLFKRTISSFSIADDAEETLGERLIEAHARLLLAEDERLKLEGAFAFAKEEIKTNTDELSAEVVKTTQQFAQYDGEFASTYQQITAVSTAQGTTAQELTQFKVQAASDIETAKGEAIAEAEDVITATVGYCLLDNAITTHTDRAACEAAGGTWQKLPLAEAFEKMTVSFTDSNGDEVAGSALSLFQAIVNDQNQLFARAFVGTDVDGKLTGIYIQDESGNPVLGTIQLVSSVTEFLRENGTKFITFDATGNIATLDGQLKLSDGTVIGSVEDIRAQDGADGDTIYTEEQYSVDGSTAWHWPMATGDVYRRERIVTNGVGGAWSAAARIKGDTGDTGPQGVPGADGANGVTTYTWIRYADDAAGAGISNDPTGKTYIGFAYNKTTATESSTPADYTWSKIQGEQGDTGVPGAPGNDGQTTYTWIKYSANADGTGLTDLPQSNTVYIGIAVNKTTATESTNKADYVWSKWKGDTGATGATGATGPQGPAGNDGHPGAAFHRLVLRGGIFPSSTTATADFISAFGRSPVLDDVLTYVNSDDSVASTKRYSGTTWITPGALFTGDILVKGTVAGDRFAAGTEMTAPIVRGGLFIASAMQVGSNTMLTPYNKLAPTAIDDYAQSISSVRTDRAVVLEQLIGPAWVDVDIADYDPYRLCFYKSDIKLDVFTNIDSSQNDKCTLYIDVYYEMTDTSHAANAVWENVKTVVVNSLESFDTGSARLIYRYTTREEPWNTLKIRVRCEASTTAGKPASLVVSRTIFNNVESPNTAHGTSNDNEDQPSYPKPTLPPGGGYEP